MFMKVKFQFNEDKHLKLVKIVSFGTIYEYLHNWFLHSQGNFFH